MEVKFIKCTSAKLSSVPVTDGQIIVLTDSNTVLYDMGSTRRYASVVKSISDNYTSSAGAASAGVAASSKAVYDCYTACNNKLKWLDVPGCKVSFLKAGFNANNSQTYGVTIRIGNSSMSNYVDDTYYICVLSDGTLKSGCQLNGALYPTWYIK